MSTVIVGFVLVASLGSVNSIVKARESDFGTVQARTLAFDLMAEIMQQAYQEPNMTAKETFQRGTTTVVSDQGSHVEPLKFGPEGGEKNRVDFDDVDDYDGYSKSPLVDKDGQQVPNATGWTRAVTVSFASPTTLQATDQINDTGIKLITVTVTAPDGTTTTLCGLRSSSSNFDQTYASNTSFLSDVGITLQVGSDSTTAIKSAATLWSKPTVPN